MVSNEVKKIPKIYAAFIALVAFLFFYANDSLAQSTRPLVGVIRYNQFYKDGDSDIATLSPDKWHDRIPWCLDVAPNVVSGNCDSQAEYDQDMRHAMTANIDYFAHLYNGGSQIKPIQYHLASPYKDQVKFAVIIMQWNATAWASRIDPLISYFKNSSYQKVLNGRPLVYIFDPGILESYYGQGAGTQAKINEIRTKAQAAGLPDPYIVTMAGGIDQYGLDAVSRYLYIGPGENHQGYPFADHMFPNIAYWDKVGYDQIPNVSLGYDERPRWEIPPPWGTGGGPWFEQPTAAETNQIVGAGLDWVKQHPSRAPANSILVYGWDEVAEGGWLIPTHTEGDARVRSLGSFLNSYGSSSICTPNWQCSSWSTCTNNQQSRTCTDSNNCGTISGRPATSQSCGTSGCTDLNFISGSVSPTSVSPGDIYTMQCDYGSVVNSISANPGSGSCTYTDFSGTTANFSCTAGTTSGTFSNFCTLKTGTSANTCARQDSINSLTVASSAQAYCGDNSCNNGETCSTCASDCGSCPPSAKTYTLTDFTNLVNDWLKSMTGSPADVNSDGKVNSRDLGIMMSNWEDSGTTQPPVAGCSTELNGTFAQNTTGWRTDGGGSALSWQNASSGDGSTGYMRFNIANNGDYDRFATSSGVNITTPNTVYQVSFWYRTSGITGDLQVFSTDTLGTLGETASWAADKITPSASWKQFSTTLAVDSADYPVFGISKLGSIGTGTFDVDAISVCSN